MSGMISVDEACQRLSAYSLCDATETICLAEAYGRRLATPIEAVVARPPAAVSAMDGYAVRLEDVSHANTVLKIIGEAPAGAPFLQTLNSGQAVRIFTGAELPEGADHIVIQEDTTREGETVICHNGYTASQFVRRAGLDFHRGDTLLPAGKTLGPAELAVIASANIGRVEVLRRPRIGILANGNELQTPGASLPDGHIPNANPYGLSALIYKWGGEPVDLGIAGDSKTSIIQHIQNADAIDLFLPVGGASVGDHDHMRSAFADLGFTSVFERIAVKPGKPTWFSKRSQDAVLGLPGNPASALVCAHIFLRHLLTYGTASPSYSARLTTPLDANGPRETFLRAALDIGPDGTLRVSPAPNQDSSLISPFLTCNALIRRLPHEDVKSADALVDCLLIGDLS